MTLFLLYNHLLKIEKMSHIQEFNCSDKKSCVVCEIEPRITVRINQHVTIRSTVALVVNDGFWI